ncbi:hypothetical protein [Leptolyngbya sp. BC1307]|uniref:hypothetical protein n=1 Tax=Leptolyngbya sp. BC1307 TaxID=2029589 RepID=UPI000EFA874C|nr:hypothetical protein [Leptolyngbya sp. BC1307]
MPIDSKRSRIPVFFAIGIGLSLLLAALKAIAAWLADVFLYSVPWIGGFLKSIELIELFNLVVFAILGAGIGAATVLLPRRWKHPAKMALLVVVSPFVFSASYMMQQNLWIREVANQSSLSYGEARDLTNDFLRREGDSGGFFGFYPFSTQFTDLPTRREELEGQRLTNPTQALSEELASYDDPRADAIAYVFERVGWLMRLMYMALAALTALIYYFKGHEWAERQRQASEAGSSQRKPG